MENEASSRYKWLIIGLLTAGNFSIMGISSLWGPIMPSFIDSLSITRTQGGLILTVFSLSGMITIMLWGAFIDKTGVNNLYGYIAIILGFIVLSIGFMSSYTLILAIMFFIGLIIPSQNIFRQKATMDWFSKSERATANGITIMCLGLVPFVFTPLATYLIDTIGYSWSVMLFIAGTIVVLVGVCLRFLYRSPRSVQKSTVTSGSVLKRLSGLGILVKNRNVMLAHIGFSASNGTMQMATAWGITYLRTELELEPMVAAAIMMTWSLAGMFRPLGGIINDRIFKGRRKLSCVPSALFEGLICLILVVIPRNTSVYIIGLIFFLLSFSRAMWGASGSIWGAELAPLDLVGSSIALQGLISGIIRSAFPLLLGWIVDVTNSFTYGWLSVALIELAVTVPSWAMVKEGDSK